MPRTPYIVSDVMTRTVVAVDRDAPRGAVPWRLPTSAVTLGGRGTDGGTGICWRCHERCARA